MGDASKFRATSDCNKCTVRQCIFSKAMVGSNQGPTKANLESHESFLDSGNYKCEIKTKIHGGTFFVQRALRCGSAIESQFYNPRQYSLCGGRISTIDICCFCYINAVIVSPEEIMNKRDMGGEFPIPLCRDYFIWE